MAPRRGWASPRGSGSFQRQRLGTASSDSNLAFRSPCRCQAPGERVGFDDLIWTRPSPNRAPRGRVSRRCLASRFANAGRPIRLAGANRRAWHPHGEHDEEPGRSEGPPSLMLLFQNRQRRHARPSRPPRSGWAGVFVLRSSGLVLRSVTGTVTGSGSGGRRISLFLVPCSLLPRGRGIRLRLRLRRDTSRISYLASCILHLES